MKATLTSLLLLVIISCYGQKDLSVISKSGVYLRAEPDGHSEIVKTIPFLGEVKSLESFSWPIPLGDTIATYYVRTDRNEAQERFIIGNWRQVVHEKDTGYVNDAFLSRLDNSTNDSLNINYGITYEWTNCFDNIHRNKLIEWKGLFKNAQGYEIRDIQLDYYNTHGEMAWFGVKLNDTKDLILCLGSYNDTFFNGPIQGEYFKNGQIFEYSKEAVIESKFDFFEVRTINKRPTVYLKKGNKKQRLLSASPASLLWKGDLDYDGEDDYIISFGEKGMGIFLYLSSEAESNEIAKPVAAYSAGYCC